MSQLLTTGPPRSEPFPGLAGLGTVLGVWAHPDDETYLTGGLLAALADAGQRAVCVTATRGEAADPDSSAGERAALACLRAHELGVALDVLGVAEHHWLGYPDGGCAGLDVEGPVRCLAAIIDRVRPDTVITFGPDGFTGHPDHVAVGAWTTAALRRTSVSPRLLHPVALEPAVDPQLDEDFGVFELGRPRVCAGDELALRLPLSGALLDRKVEALMAQESQTGGLVSAVGIERYRAWVATEAFAEPETG